MPEHVQRCAFCGLSVPELLPKCPQCGEKVKRDPGLKIIAAAAVILAAIVGVVWLWKDVGADRQPSIGYSQGRAAGGFVESAGNIWPGTELYLRSTHEPVCKVVKTESKHRFEDGTVSDGVMVAFNDASVMWLPRDSVKRLYLTK